MQINNDIKTVLFAPSIYSFQCKPFPLSMISPSSRLDNIVIHRHTDVIKSHCSYLFNILFGYGRRWNNVRHCRTSTCEIHRPGLYPYKIRQNSHGFPPCSFRHRTGSPPAISLVYSFIITAKAGENQYLNCGGFLYLYTLFSAERFRKVLFGTSVGVML